MPFTTSVPCVETWRGLPLQCGVGVHATLVIRTLVTCAPLPVAGALDPVAGALGAFPPAEVPPMFAAHAPDAARQHATTAAGSAVASAVNRFAATLLAGITETSFVPR
jgi:hypothetical protein